MLEAARRRAHEATRCDPGDLDAWVDLARAVAQAGGPPEELTPGDFAHLLASLSQEPSARDLAGLAMAALGVEARPPRFAGSRWRPLGQAGEDECGPYDAATGMPLAVHHASLAMDFAWVPPGRYPLGWLPPESIMVGGGAAGERLLTSRQVARHIDLVTGFYLATTPTTQAQYRALTGENPSFRPGEDRPVEFLLAEDVDRAAARAEARRGGVPCGWSMRVPDGDRWEVALRGEAGPRRASLQDGWFKENAGARTHPVGLRQPAQHGTVDQFGNVSEWCSDEDESMSPPVGREPATGLRLRMARGGAWSDPVRDWGASRFDFHIVSGANPTHRASVGMRLLLGPPPPPESSPAPGAPPETEPGAVAP